MRLLMFFFVRSQSDPSKLDKYGKILLHGNGCNRWFDKSFTLCIGSNGRVNIVSQILVSILIIVVFRLVSMLNILGEQFYVDSY